MKFCPNCGAPKAAPEDAVCASCGEAYPIVVQPSAQAFPASDAPAPVPEAPAPAELPATGGEGVVRPTARQIPQLPREEPQPESTTDELQSSIDKILSKALNAEDIADLPTPPPAQKTSLFDYDAEMDAPAPAQGAAVGATQVFSTKQVAEALAGGAQPPVAPQAPPAPAAPPPTLFEEPPADLFAEPQEAASEPQEALFEQPAAGPVYTPQQAPNQVVYDDGYDTYTEDSYVQQPYEEPPYEEQPYAEQNAAMQGGLFAEEAYAEPNPYAAEEEYVEVSPYAKPGFVDTYPEAGRQPRQQMNTLFDEQPAPQQRPAERAAVRAVAQQEDKWSRLQANSLQDLYDDQNADDDGGIPLPPYEEEDYEPRRKKGGGGGRKAILIIVGVLVFVLGVFGATMGMLYYNNNANKTISGFVAALGSKDTATLQGIVSLPDVENTDGGWQALCEAFASSVERAALESQLKDMAKGSSAGAAYPFIQLKSEPLFLFINSYHIEISSVNLVLVGEDASSQLTLNGEDKFGSYDEASGGVRYVNLMPGTYTYVLYRQGSTSAPNTVTLLSETTTLDAAAGSGHTVTIGNAISDDAVVYVNGSEVGTKPSGGVVILENLELGSQVRIVVNQDGQQREATVTFTDENNTTLSFENYTGEDPVAPQPEQPQTSNQLSVENINAILAEYYRSYLTCINEQSMNSIARSTSSNNTALTSRIVNDLNSPYTFEYVSAAVEGNVTYNNDGTISFVAAFSYKYSSREGDEKKDEPGSNKQNIVLVEDGGTWKVNSMTW